MLNEIVKYKVWGSCDKDYEEACLLENDAM